MWFPYNVLHYYYYSVFLPTHKCWTPFHLRFLSFWVRCCFFFGVRQYIVTYIRQNSENGLLCVLGSCIKMVKIFYLCFFRSSQFSTFYFLSSESFLTPLWVFAVFRSMVGCIVLISLCCCRCYCWAYNVQLVWKCADTRFTSFWLKFSRTTVAQHTQNHSESQTDILFIIIFAPITLSSLLLLLLEFHFCENHHMSVAKSNHSMS